MPRSIAVAAVSLVLPRGRSDCAEIVIQTMATNEPKVLLPCTGDRVLGMATDSEMVFACPWDFADEIVAGLSTNNGVQGLVISMQRS
jgi:uncharacterized protein (DUF169 family)